MNGARVSLSAMYELTGGKAARAPAIALLTPYLGSNLGDRSIQTAAIAALRKRCPDAHITLISLYPENTSRIHGVEGYPITGFDVPNYSSRNLLNSYRANPAPNPAGTLQQTAWWVTLRGFLGRFPLIRAIHRSFAPARAVYDELAYLSRSWRFVRNIDLIVVAGGGQLDDEWGGGWGHPYALLRWALLAALQGKPFAVVSVGACKARWFSRQLLKLTLSLASYRSYRDLGTLQLVRSWGIGHRDRCVADLAFSLEVPHTLRRGCDDSRVIAINPIAFGHPDVWPTPSAEVYDRYIDRLTEFIIWLLEQGMTPKLFGTSGSDQTAIADLQTRLAKRLPGESGRHAVDAKTALSLQELLVFLSGTRLVVASRLHAVMLSHLLAKPVIAISFDRKVAAHMEQAGQRLRLFNIESVELGQLIGAFQSTVMQTWRLSADINREVRAWRPALDKQYDCLLELATYAADRHLASRDA